MYGSRGNSLGEDDEDVPPFTFLLKRWERVFVHQSASSFLGKLWFRYIFLCLHKIRKRSLWQFLSPTVHTAPEVPDQQPLFWDFVKPPSGFAQCAPCGCSGTSLSRALTWRGFCWRYLRVQIFPAGGGLLFVQPLPMRL